MLVVLMCHVEMDCFGLAWLDSMYSVLKERKDCTVVLESTAKSTATLPRSWNHVVQLV